MQQIMQNLSISCNNYYMQSTLRTWSYFTPGSQTQDGIETNYYYDVAIQAQDISSLL